MRPSWVFDLIAYNHEDPYACEDCDHRHKNPHGACDEFGELDEECLCSKPVFNIEPTISTCTGCGVFLYPDDTCICKKCDEAECETCFMNSHKSRCYK